MANHWVISFEQVKPKNEDPVLDGAFRYITQGCEHNGVWNGRGPTPSVVFCTGGSITFSD